MMGTMLHPCAIPMVSLQPGQPLPEGYGQQLPGAMPPGGPFALVGAPEGMAGAPPGHPGAPAGMLAMPFPMAVDPNNPHAHAPMPYPMAVDPAAMGNGAVPPSSQCPASTGLSHLCFPFPAQMPSAPMQQGSFPSK